MASISACGGAPEPSSILTNPMKRGMSLVPSGWRGVALLHGRRTADELFDIDVTEFFRTPVGIPAGGRQVERRSAPFRSGRGTGPPFALGEPRNPAALTARCRSHEH